MVWFEIFLLCAVAFLLNVYRPKIKGFIGEHRVAKQFSKLELEGYRIINDTMLQTKRGTSQIDHVILTPFGIIVVETKNFSGWIFGDEKSDYWIKNVYGKKYKFQNPLKQNYGHIKALKEVLPDYKHVSFHSFIVFAGIAEIKSSSINSRVVKPEDLYSEILAHRGIEQLNSEDIEKIYNLLIKINIKDRKIRKQHVKGINKSIGKNKRLNNSKVCPKCNATLVLRSSKYGEFYGCSNFPKCRFKTNT